MTPITDIDEQTRNEENTKLNYITSEIQKKWSAEGDQIIMVNCPQILGQFKQLSRLEFSNQDFAGYAHYYSIR